MLQSLVTSLLAFVSTNIDDIFLLMLFFSSGRFKTSSIIGGQYLGIASLIVISLIGAFVGSLIDQRYVGLLGFFPIYLAIRQVVELVKAEKEEVKSADLKSGFGVFAIAGVTIANGGDNIGVYIPLLSTMSTWDKILMGVVFAVMVWVWCIIARYLAYHPILANYLARYGHVIMPIVLFALGIFILHESKTASLLF
jgi:cadmium resistance transport/sequestration family protein